jgi:UPF0176 protein
MELARKRGEAHIGADAAKALIAKREAKMRRLQVQKEKQATEAA